MEQHIWFDYEHQAWVRDGRYENCGHPSDMNCGCYGRLHQGESAEANQPKQISAVGILKEIASDPRVSLADSEQRIRLYAVLCKLGEL